MRVSGLGGRWMVYVIIVYDVAVERVDKVRKFLKQYLNWIQNSVFEGEVSVGDLAKIRVGLKKIIDKNVDSILVFAVSSQKWLKKEVIGIEKSEVTTII